MLLFIPLFMKYIEYFPLGNIFLSHTEISPKISDFYINRYDTR